MTKEKLITYFAVGLLLSNLMLIGFILFDKPNRPTHQGPKRIIAERLHFDTHQLAEYDKLIAEHRMNIKTKDSLILYTKTELYGCILSNNLVRKDSLQNQLGLLQIEIEKINVNHFIDIKNICKPNQIPLFNELVKDLANLFSKPKDKHNR